MIYYIRWSRDYGRVGWLIGLVDDVKWVGWLIGLVDEIEIMAEGGEFVRR